MAKHDGKYDLRITAHNKGGGSVCVSGVSEDERNWDKSEPALRFHGPNGSLVLQRAETWALIYERLPEDDEADVILFDPDGRFQGYATNSRERAESVQFGQLRRCA